MMSVPCQATSPSWRQLSLSQPCPAGCPCLVALLFVDSLPGSCSYGFLRALRLYTETPVDSCILHVSSDALGDAPALWVLLGLHVLHPLLPLFLRGCLGLGFLLTPSPSGNWVFSASHTSSAPSLSCVRPLLHDEVRVPGFGSSPWTYVHTSSLVPPGRSLLSEPEFHPSPPGRSSLVSTSDDRHFQRGLGY